MKKKITMIEESLYEFSKRRRPKRSKNLSKMRDIDTPDSWNDLEGEEEEVIDDIDVDTSDMTSVEEIEIEDSNMPNDELQTALNNEIQMLEINRRVLTFTLKTDMDRKVYNGIPMAKMGNGEAFLFKLDDGKIKKVFINDIITEQQKRKNDRALTINE